MDAGGGREGKGDEYRGQEWDRKGARCLSLSLCLSLVSFVPVWFEAHRSKGSGSHDPA